MYDIIIVGGGPAGLTAAIYARRSSKRVLVLEAKNCGGQIINALDIENYPAVNHISGFEFAEKLYNQVNDLDVDIIFEKAINIENKENYKRIITEKKEYLARTVILATGSDNRKLGLDKEDELIGKGISYCATCDGNFYKNKNVAVVGGGKTAIEDAIYLSSIANKVYLIHRTEKFRAEDSMVNSLKAKKNVEFICNSNITKLNGEDKLENIEITTKDKTKKNITIDGLFVAVGRIPENQNFGKLINLDNNGYVIANEDCKTNISGIFVAGDNRIKKVRQLVTATADGAVAAIAAINYLNKE